MRIHITDDFDDEFEKEYRDIDSESIVGNGKLGRNSGEVIDVYATPVKTTNARSADIKSDYKDIEENNNFKYSTENINTSNVKNEYKVEIQGATFIEEDNNKEKVFKKENKFEEENDFEKNFILSSNYENDDYEERNRKQSKSGYTKNSQKKAVKGKITVCSRLGDKKGTLISSARINLYMLNGVSPKLVDSKLSDENGLVVFDNLEEGSYRIIAIVNRKYFDKPTYIKWNEVTINDELSEENIVVINRIKSNARR